MKLSAEQRMEDLERKIAEVRSLQASGRRGRNALRNIRLKPDWLGMVFVGDKDGTLDLSLLTKVLNYDPDGEEEEDEPIITGYTCTSRTGSGHLRGWSKYANPNSGDLNERKYTVCAVSQSPNPWVTYNEYSDGICAPGAFVEACTDLTHDSGQFIWDVSANTQLTAPTVKDYKCGHNVVDNTRLPTVATLWDTAFGGGATETFATPTDTSRTRSFDTSSVSGACVGGCGCLNTIRKKSGIDCVITGQLGSPDTVSAALDRESVTPGALCKTAITSVGTTTAVSTSQIDFTATAVDVAIAVANLVTSATYRISAVLKRYTPGTSTLVSTTTVLIDFVAAGPTDSVPYRVPVEDTADVLFDSTTSIVAL